MVLIQTLAAPVLITGGTGFLGSNLLKCLADQNYPVILVKRSFSNVHRIRGYLDRIKSYDIDEVNLADIFSAHSIGTILHCSTDYGRKTIDFPKLIDANPFLPLSLL